jgi:hypothetical protein
MKKTPKAKKFIKEYLKDNPNGTYDTCMIEFAKVHCELQLKTILNNVRIRDEWSGNTGSEYCYTVVDRESIINAYPIENIK